MNEMNAKDRINNLPKWAQEFIRSQDRSITTLMKQVDNLKKTIEEKYKETQWAWEDWGNDQRVFIPEEAHVVLHPDNPRRRIVLHLAEDLAGETLLEVQSGGPLDIQPRASNLIRVKVRQD